MGLFRKAKKENVELKETNTLERTDFDKNKSEIEIVDFDTKEEKIENTLVTRKENRIIFIIIAALFLVVFLLPTLTSWFQRNSIFSYSDKVEEIVNNNTIDGMLEVGKEEGSITVKKIRFYNAAKRTNNQISLIYLPETEIKNVNNMEIYIELYNSSKNVIYRTKFTSDKKLERKVQGIFTMPVNEMIYKEATYIKVTIIKEDEFKTETDSMLCVKTFTDEDYKLEYEALYSFSNSGLISYKIRREVVMENSETDEVENEQRINKYAEYFEKEAEELSKTNVTDIAYDETSIEYTIDLLTFDLGKSDFSNPYSIGNVKRQIKLNEEANKWSCK